MQTLPPGVPSSDSADPNVSDLSPNGETTSKNVGDLTAQKGKASKLTWLERPFSKTPRDRGTKLRTRLLQTILPAVLLPLMMAGLMGYRVIAQRSEERIQEQLKNQALLASEGTTAVLDDLLDLPRSVANSPLVVNEARVGSQEAEEAGLTDMSVEEIEAAFAETKLLRTHTALNTYLRQTVETAEIAELLVTDSHGFNVAYSRPVADMVQSDEDWWQSGKANQQWIGPPDFDFASKGFTVELVQAIRDPQNNNRFVGIIKAILPTRKFSLLANTLQRTGITGSQRVQLIDGEKLSTIDTFSAQGFHKDRDIIGGEPVEQFISGFITAIQGEPQGALADEPASQSSSSIVAQRERRTEVLSALQSMRKQQPAIQQISLPIADEDITVASFTVGDRQYKVANIASSNWVAIASMDQSEVAESGRDSLLFFSLFTLVLGGLTTGLIFWLSRQLSHPIGQLTEQVEIAASGNLDVAIEPTGTAETRFLTQTFNQLLAQTKSLLQTQHTETEKVRLFADITSAPIFKRDEIDPLLASILPTAREILAVDRLAFFQVEKGETSLEPTSQHANQSRDPRVRGWISAESVAEEQLPANSYPDDTPWLPAQVLSIAADQASTSVVHSLNDDTLDIQYKAFLSANKVKSSLSVPVVYDIGIPGSAQTVAVLWGYLIAHRTDVHRTEVSRTGVSRTEATQSWLPTEIEFLEQLSCQLKLVLDRMAAGASVQKSHRAVQRSRLETEAITRKQEQQREHKRLEDEQLKAQIAALSHDISGVFDGDLTVRAKMTPGELQTVAKVFNTTVAKLEELVGNVKGATTEIDEVLSQKEQTAQQLARLTQQQSQEALRTLETLQAVSQSMHSAVDQAHHAANVAQQVTDRTVTGREAVHQATQKIQTLNTISSSAVSQIQQLTRSSHNVSYMVTMISEIATEMRSLATETAQDINTWTGSGELAPAQSQTLAKVTATMAKLAERALSEAGLIGTFLSSVGTTTGQMSEAMDKINQALTDGHQTMGASQQELSEVLTVAQQFEQLAQSVSLAIEEQSQASQQASELVNAVVSLSQQASHFSEEIARSLQDTATSAHQLRSSVDFFKVTR